MNHMKDIYNDELGPLMPTPEEPHGWIQWKGTDVCMDIRCDCDSDNLPHHVDADFAYVIKLPCGKYVAPDPHVRLVALTPEQAKRYEDEGEGLCLATAS